MLSVDAGAGVDEPAAVDLDDPFAYDKAIIEH
jgi:hypothetical protein